MKLIWAILINVAFLLIVAAITVCLLVYLYQPQESDDQQFQPVLEGYKNHQLIQFTPASEYEIRKLVELQNKLYLVPWSKVLRPGWPVLFQIPPNSTKLFSLSTEALHLPFILVSPNLEEYLTNKKRVITDFNLEKSLDFNLNRYHYYTEIEKYLNKLSEEKTGSRLILSSYGSSIENRQLYYVRIYKSIEEASRGDDQPLKEKKIVILECGAHSREWLSPAVCLKFINNLLYDPESQELLEDYEFYILPLINPDGYAYSWTRDRMWRKNRRRFANNCYGVDLNRNFNIGFNTSEIPKHIHLIKDLEELEIYNSTIRSKREADISANEPTQCSNVYPGERPFSENETFYLKRFVDRFINKPNVYISLHAYSQMWLYPFGTNLVSKNDDKLYRYAKIGVENLHKYRKSQNITDLPDWKFGRSIEVMYKAGGVSIDWAHKDVGIDLVYTIEMRDSGSFGFLLPEDQISPAAEETWIGISSVLRAYAEELNNSTLNSITTTEIPSST